MAQLVYFGDSATNAPRTGLTLTWVSLLKVSDGTAFTPQPVFTEVGAGFYKFDIPAENVCGSIDGGAALPTVDRYIRDILIGPEDTYLDAAITSRSTYAGGAVASVTAPVTVGTNSDKTGYALSTAGVQSIWDALTSALTTAGSIGKKLTDWLGGAGANNISITLLNASAPAQVVTAATQGNPCQLTIAAHGRSNGDKVVTAGIGGMVELNNRLLTVTVVDANNITVGIDSTAFTPYTTGGTITKTDEAAIQSAHLSIYDATNTNLYATAETNASGVSVQGGNSYVAMDSGSYVLRPTRSLLNATGDYAFSVTATATKYFVGTALSIPASGNPQLQRLYGSVKELGIAWAAGDIVAFTPEFTQSVNGGILSNAPLVVTVDAFGALRDPSDGLLGVRVDKGARLVATISRAGTQYYYKAFTVSQADMADLSAY